MIHKIRDAIAGRREKFLCDHGTRKQEITLLSDSLGSAECFDFGTLPLEVADTSLYDDSPEPDNKKLFALPDLTLDERMWWADGLIPLPAPVCWYEYQLPQSQARRRFGLLVCDIEEGVKNETAVMRVERGADDTFYFDGVLFTVPRENLRGDSGNLTVKTYGNQDIIETIRKERGEMAVIHLFGASVMLGIYLTLMLSSRSTEIAWARTPPKLARAQIHRRETPLPDHRVVNLVPQRYRIAVPGQGGHHRPPRLHWRRSHLRHFDHQTEGAKWLEHVVWRDKTGWFVTVIPRFIVGLADHGKLTHEYKVRAT